MTEEEQRRLTETESRSKSNTHRIDKLESQNAVLVEMSKNMAVMAADMKNTGQKVDRIDRKVEVLEGKPGKLYDGIVEKIIWAVVAAALTFILSHIGL